MAPSIDAKGLVPLIDSAINLIQQLQSSLATIQKSEPSASSQPASASTHPLRLARDSASLIRAHSTKLSLLVITDPFTPSAIATLIRELVAGPLTGLATAVELCDPKYYTSAFRKELSHRCDRVYSGLLDLLNKVPLDGKVLTGKAKEGFGAGAKGSFGSTGVLWNACDNLTGLVDQGVAGFYVVKVEGWRDILKDVMQELKEWGEEEPDESDDEGYDTEQPDDAQSSAAQAAVDDLMSSPTIPRNDTDNIRPRLDSTLKRLGMVAILYQAISKRRLKKLPKPAVDSDTPLDPAIIQRLNNATKKMGDLPDDFGDLAAAFYELDPEEIDEQAERCFGAAVEVGEGLSKGWEGDEDEFTTWLGKFKTEVLKGPEL